jgi:predicted glycoside hydrolase/deacetylase ChbG (UPF0249 family)
MRTAPTLAQRLGYAASAKLLIVNCDDLGSSHAANVAIHDALAKGAATSATLMAPCGAARAAAELCAQEDVGVHLTLNSEWETAPWSPLSGAASLSTADARLHPTPEDTWRLASLDDVRRECRAQIDRVRSWGVDVTHLDTHMGTLLLRDDFAKVYVEIAAELGLPVRLLSAPRGRVMLGLRLGRPRSVARRMATSMGVAAPDRLVLCPIPARHKIARVLHELEPGVTEVFLHPAVDTPELRRTQTDWSGRVDDHAFLCEDASILEIVDESGATLIGYRELRDLQRAQQ